MKSNLEYAPLALLCVFTGKLLLLNSWSYENALVFAALAGISAVFHLKSKNDELKAINLLLEQQKADIEELKKQTDSVKTTISGMKMAQSVKQVGRF
jgi:hypothetical protein